jgi:general stress protein 26
MSFAACTDMHATSDNHSSTSDTAHLTSLIREFETGLLVTRRANSALHVRPMALAGVDDDATLWFVTSSSSAKVKEIEQDARATVALQGSARYVVLDGKVEATRDRAKIQEMWKETYRVWYDGKSDPDIVLLRFTPSEAEYWDSSGIEGLKYVFRAAQAYLTRQPLKNDPDLKEDSDAHAKLRL